MEKQKPNDWSVIELPRIVSVKNMMIDRSRKDNIGVDRSRNNISSIDRSVASCMVSKTNRSFVKNSYV